MIDKGPGFDFCRQLKGDTATRKTQILMVTSLNEPGDVERAVEAGTDGFLSILVFRPEFVKRIENLLEIRRLL